MSTRLVRLLKEYGYDFEVETYNDFNHIFKLGNVRVIVCGDGYIVSDVFEGETVYEIMHDAYHVIDYLDNVM